MGKKAADPADRPLTPKQAAFVQHYTDAGGGVLFNATGAARKAGYNGADHTLTVVGRENLRKPYVWRAIRRELTTRYAASDLTVERVLADIEMTRQLAIQAGNLAVALKATELHGKYLTMFVERIEHVHTVEDADDAQLVELANRLMGRIDGLDIAGGTRGDGPESGADAGAAGARATH